MYFSSPLSGLLSSSRSMRGMESSTGSQWCTAQKWLIRMPISRTTTSPSAAAVVRSATVNLRRMSHSRIHRVGWASSLGNFWIVSLSHERRKRCGWLN